MSIAEFADRYRVKITTPRSRPIPPDSEDVIEGKAGMIGEDFQQDQIHGRSRMLLHILATPRNASMEKRLFSRSRAADAAGFQLKVRSGAESVWYFDPTSAPQAKAAIEIVGARKRRTVTVTLPGGDLAIEWRESDDHVLMTGTAEFEYEGRFDPALFASVA